MSEGPFLHGVASGDPRSDRVILWTRVTHDADEPVDVRWTVARDDGLHDVVASGTARAEAEHDFTVKVDAGGLEPATTYHYAFEALNARSDVGRTRTLPQGPCEHVRFAQCSCAKYSAGYFNAYARIAERDDLDFVLHLGDYIYEYGNVDKAPGPKIKRAMKPHEPCVTLEDYRTRYAHYRRDPVVRRVHARHPFIATIDDHEVADNTWRDGAKHHDPEHDGDWHERKRAALRAWHEWMPVRVDVVDGYPRINRRFSIGDLVDLFLLDDRSHRDAMANAPEPEAEDRTMLGKEQLEWLCDGLRSSRAAWRVVANGVMWGQVYTGLDEGEIGDALAEISVLTKKEHGPAPDQWDGYPAERERLFALLRDEGVEDVVFVSGDVHSAWAMDLKSRADERDEHPVGVEFVTPSITSENLDDHMHTDPRTVSIGVERQIVEENPHIHWVELDSHGYVVVEVTRERARASWWFVDEIWRPNDEERLESIWEVRAGEHRLREVEPPDMGAHD
ncbi:MAG TPA: alkaline phosphatase D family protein [Actinomycetota bacterium]|nr:alkaline phosphatase D family protein [Actinomycetota bacterium]